MNKHLIEITYISVQLLKNKEATDRVKKEVYRLLLSLCWPHPHPGLVCSRPSVHFLLLHFAIIEGEADD